MAKMGEFVAQRADQAGVAQRSARDCVAKSYLDHPVVVTNAISARHVGAFGLDRAVAETESPTDVLSIAVEPFDQGAVRVTFRHSPASLPLVSRMVKVRDAAAIVTLHTFDWIGEPAANFFLPPDRRRTAETPEFGPPAAFYAAYQELPNSSENR